MCTIQALAIAIVLMSVCVYCINPMYVQKKLIGMRADAPNVKLTEPIIENDTLIAHIS